ncbi:MAG TPA: DUF1206 domain-containing protein [Longimicrobiaceae bacterium]|nr:DUF1206 domain-containing protein [Longimicrobiaceae bacterium]
MELPVDEAKAQVREAARQAAPWVERLARLGYAARGVVYFVVGLLAVRAAFGSGRPAGPGGALETILRQPLGRVLLGVVALGLAGYALWRLVQAVLDPEHKGSDGKGLLKRAGSALSGVLYAGVALAAARMALGSPGGGDGGDGEARHWTAVLLQQPAGRWLVALVGAGIAAYGAYQLYRVHASSPTKRLDVARLDPRARQWLERGGRLGWAARGVVFGVMGIFVVRAALQYDPGEARGLQGALRTLQEQAYGPWLLGVVGMGLMAYGVFELVKARYRRIRPG